MAAYMCVIYILVTQVTHYITVKEMSILKKKTLKMFIYCTWKK